MIVKIEKRRMARAYGCKVERIDGGRVRFSVHGDNAKGRMVEFIIETEFHQWPCVARGFEKAWATEKESRLGTIARIDGALPKEQE
jgi:hypothetical protein